LTAVLLCIAAWAVRADVSIDLAADPAHRTTREQMEKLVLKDWDPDRSDELRWQSEERRLAILRALEHDNPLDWDKPSAPVPHPTRPE